MPSIPRAAATDGDGGRRFARLAAAGAGDADRDLDALVGDDDGGGGGRGLFDLGEDAKILPLAPIPARATAGLRTRAFCGDGRAAFAPPGSGSCTTTCSASTTGLSDDGSAIAGSASSALASACAAAAPAASAAVITGPDRHLWVFVDDGRVITEDGRGARVVVVVVDDDREGFGNRGAAADVAVSFPSCNEDDGLRLTDGRADVLGTGTGDG